MTATGPEELRALGELAERRPELGDRVARLVGGLARIEPVTTGRFLDRVEAGIEQLGWLGAVDTGTIHAGAPASALSDLVRYVLERAVAPGFGPNRVVTGDALALIAEGLGRRFETAPMAMLDLFERIPEAERDFREQVAWLAARGGGDALLAAVAGALDDRTELVLGFLEAAVRGADQGPFRGAAKSTAERPQERWEGRAVQPPPGYREERAAPPPPAEKPVRQEPQPAPPPPAEAPVRQEPQPAPPPPAEAPVDREERPTWEAPVGREPAPPSPAPAPARPPRQEQQQQQARPPPPADRPDRPPPPPVRAEPPARARSRGGGAVRRWMDRAADAFRGGRSTRGIPPQPDLAPPPAPRPPAPPAPAVVSTGFTTRPGEPGLAPDRTLAKGRRYLFFVEIGAQLTADAIDTAATPLPDLPAGTVLQVVLFGFDGELAPEPGADVGELLLVGDGRAVVETQPGGAVPGERRLLLPVTTPDRTGVARMRCNLYCRQVLLQSRLVEVQVTDEEQGGAGPGLRSVLDFAVVSELRPEHVEGLQPRALSLMVNDNGNGTHGFRFFAGTEFKHDATLTGEALGQALEQVRSALRLSSWATATEPTRADFATLAYRYANPGPTTLGEDLITMARSGFIVWDLLIDQLAGSGVSDLIERMRIPGVVELANKESLDLLVPAACIYDHPLNPEDAALTICPDFVAARGTTPLDATPCFQGACPSYDDPTVVCPSGFWGFRHQIGYSASLTGGEDDDARDQALAIPAGPAPVFTAGASTDPGLPLREAHLDRVKALAGQWTLATSRTQLFDNFRTSAPSVVYLYGHGGRQGRAAFFEVGSGQDGPIIRASLRGKADWRATRPLVFLNGCHSAALAPDAAFSYATGFLQTAHASAVVGTEIAVFEKLATAFAEGCLRRFVTERQPLGQAVRGARLALLEQGVPLGLVYLAFGPSELHLE